MSDEEIVLLLTWLCIMGTWIHLYGMEHDIRDLKRRIEERRKP